MKSNQIIILPSSSSSSPHLEFHEHALRVHRAGVALALDVAQTREIPSNRRVVVVHRERIFVETVPETRRVVAPRARLARRARRSTARARETRRDARRPRRATIEARDAATATRRTRCPGVPGLRARASSAFATRRRAHDDAGWRRAMERASANARGAGRRRERARARCRSAGSRR